jgi:hypothetical protein
MQKRRVVAQVGACVSLNGRPAVRLGCSQGQRQSLKTTVKLTTWCTLGCRRSVSKFLAGLSQHHVGCRSRDHKMWTFGAEGGAPSCHPWSWVVNANKSPDSRHRDDSPPTCFHELTGRIGEHCRCCATSLRVLSKVENRRISRPFATFHNSPPIAPLRPPSDPSPREKIGRSEPYDFQPIRRKNTLRSAAFISRSSRFVAWS